MRSTTLVMTVVWLSLNATMAVATAHAATADVPLAQADRATKISFNILRQPLADALAEWSRQSGLQVLRRDTDNATEITSPQISGQYSPAEALERMLAESGLEYEFVNDRTVRIAAKTTARLNGADNSDFRFAEKDQGSVGSSDMQHVSQATSSSSPSGDVDCSLSENKTHPSCELTEIDQKGIPEVLINGSRVLNMDIRRTKEDIQPYTVFEREALELSQAVNVEDFLKQRLPMNTNIPTYGGRGLSGGASSLNLRGLGSNQTLILIDGRRTASHAIGGTPEQPDLNGIPLSAIERIEVLPTTASGIYGGSATGGVINLVLRRDYNGIESKITFDNTFKSDSAERKVDLSAGFNLEGGKTNVLFAGTYSDANALLIKDREFLARGRALTLANNPATFINAFFPPAGATTNVRSTTGANLTLDPQFGGASLGSPITYVPDGYAGPASDAAAALVANAGQYNLQLPETAETVGGGTRALVSTPRVESVMATVRREFTPLLQGYLEIAGSNNTGRYPVNNAPVTGFVIPGSAPSNPFTTDIRVSTPAYGADRTQVSTLYKRRAVAGLIAQLPKEWRMGVEYTWNRVRHSASTPGGLSAQATSAIASGTLDLLRDTRQAGVDFDSFVVGPNVRGPTYSTISDAVLRFAGPAWTLPAGNIITTMLLERREEVFSDTESVSPTSRFLHPRRSQEVSSAYLEIQMPVISTRNLIRGVRALDLQLAGRWDDYKVDSSTAIVNLLAPAPTAVERFVNRNSSIDPTVGLRYQPVADVVLRASYGTGYLPPAVDQLVPVTPDQITGSNLLDPRRGNEPLGDYTIFQGGNSLLRPEKSESWSAGIILTPRITPGMRLSVDWSKIDKRDNITAVADGLLQSDFSNEAFVPGLIIRGPVPAGDSFGIGPVIGINAGLFNIARAEVEALDFAIDYHLELETLGTLEFSSSATRMIHLKTQVTPIAPLVENAGVGGAQAITSALDWKAIGTITWQYGNATLSWTSRFFDSYWINAAHALDADLGSARVPSQIYSDIVGSYRFNDVKSGWGLLSNTVIQLGIKNIFNREPPIDNPTGLGYSRWGDPRLASYHLSLRKSFF